jgi:hypothetical protein
MPHTKKISYRSFFVFEITNDWKFGQNCYAAELQVINCLSWGSLATIIIKGNKYSPFFYYSPMSLVRIKKSTWPASAFDIWRQCMVLPIFENLFKQHETDIVFFRAFLVFLQIHSSVLILSFKKPRPSERFW